MDELTQEMERRRESKVQMESGGREETDADEIEGGEETPFFLLLLIQDDANGGGEGCLFLTARVVVSVLFLRDGIVPSCSHVLVESDERRK